ncbi:MAG: NAD(P)-dependent oxidoreductase [Phycisphaerales bacterium]|nr:MAG: NAD(P)-dependent oxidoreductase [Phycisphaerales bacterium]
MTDLRIGWIGAGIMGLPMASNLLMAGYRVAVYNRTRARIGPLVEIGAAAAESPAEAARQADVVISIVSDSPDVEQVYLGEGGVCDGVRPGTLCIDMSTVSPQTARDVDERLRHLGVAFLDAPVSGGKTGAERGTLAIMVGGAAADLERARPVFEVLGKRIVHCGPVGFGQLTKLCNQIICGLNLLAVGEAVTFARANGLDPKVMLEAVSAGAAGSWAVDNLGPRMVSRDFAPMFMIDLQQKDLRLTLAAAGQRQLPLPGTALVQQLLAANQAHGEGREGTQALVKTLERLAATLPCESRVSFPPSGSD